MVDPSHQHCVKVGDSTEGVADQIKKGYVYISEASHYPASPGKFTLKCLKRGTGPKVVPQMEDKLRGFSSSHGTTDQPFTLGLGVFLSGVHGF